MCDDRFHALERSQRLPGIYDSVLHNETAIPVDAVFQGWMIRADNEHAPVTTEGHNRVDPQVSHYGAVYF
ncbi:MAG TPA: hypothetical protein ENH10_10295 [Bacteroidetes bacterium]|nr:hypothetical protein BMS3Bbin04_01014 [bacterium BMS3Bbin04]HDO66396.1 hypothetical protein [Bacteroidota bacterium]HEX05521.1 hypothetical protein [Bacteroidota bacterium]